MNVNNFKNFLQSKIYIILPIYNENYHLKNILKCFANQSFKEFFLIIANSLPSQDTQNIISFYSEKLNIKQIKLNKDNFWASQIYHSQKYLLDQQININSNIVFCNCDITFNNDFLKNIHEKTILYKNSMIVPLFLDNKIMHTSGLKIKSWYFSINKHYFKRKILDEKILNKIFYLDMISSNFVIMPSSILYNVGTVNHNLLPHYGADYEYSHRAKLKKYQLVLDTSLSINIFSKRTGGHNWNRKNKFLTNLKLLFDIKSTLNLKYRTRFILNTHKGFAKISSLIINYFKILLSLFS